EVPATSTPPTTRSTEAVRVVSSLPAGSGDGQRRRWSTPLHSSTDGVPHFAAPVLQFAAEIPTRALGAHAQPLERSARLRAVLSPIPLCLTAPGTAIGLPMYTIGAKAGLFVPAQTPGSPKRWGHESRSRVWAESGRGSWARRDTRRRSPEPDVPRW